MLLSHIHNIHNIFITHMLTLIIFICIDLLRNVCAFLAFILHYPAVILGAQSGQSVPNILLPRYRLQPQLPNRNDESRKSAVGQNTEPSDFLTLLCHVTSLSSAPGRDPNMSTRGHRTSPSLSLSLDAEVAFMAGCIT